MNFVGRKTQPSTLGDIPAIEKHKEGATEECHKCGAIIYRAILGFESANAKLVSHDDDFDVENGVFKRPRFV